MKSRVGQIWEEDFQSNFICFVVVKTLPSNFHHEIIVLSTGAHGFAYEHDHELFESLSYCKRIL